MRYEESDHPPWYLRIGLFFKALVMVFWIAIFVLAAANLLRQGAWILGGVMLVVLALSLIRVGQWFRLVFSTPPRRPPEPVSVPRHEAPQGESNRTAGEGRRTGNEVTYATKNVTRATIVRDHETRAIDRLFVVAAVLGVLAFVAKYIYSLYK